MSLIFFTYSRIFKVLWRIDKSIAWDESDNKKSPHQIHNQSISNEYSTVKKKKETSSSCTIASGSNAAKTKIKNQLTARRKAAKMLISVAILFAVCYLPIHILNLLR
jgi:hypothetical protein